MLTLPGWNSIETVSRLAKIFTIAGFISLFLLGAFEVLAYVYGNRKDALGAIAGQNAAASRSREDEQAEQKRSADIADAKSRAAEAERRAIRVRKRRQPGPHAAGVGHGVAKPADQATAQPRLGKPRYALGKRPRPDRPGRLCRPVVDQRLEWIVGFTTPQ